MLKEKLSHAIYISEDEEIATIADKVIKAKFAKIFLVIPPRALLFQSPVNLRILKEEADLRGTELIIVTTDQLGTMLAEKIGIKCVKSILGEKKDSAITIESKKPKVFIKRKSVAQKDQNLLKNYSGGSFWRVYRNKLIYIFPALLAVLSIVFANVFLPTANIFVLAKQNNFERIIEASLSLNAEKNSEKEIPCRQLEKEEKFSQVFPATGEKDIKDYSVGRVTIFNEWDSLKHTFSAGSKIISENGKVFKLQDTVTVSGFSRSDGKDVAGKVIAEVKAEEPGSDYNIKPGKFFFLGLKGSEKYDKIYAESSSKMSGGRISKKSVVSKDDILNVNKTIAAYIEKVDSSNFGVGDGEIVLEKSINGHIASLFISSNEGDSVDSFKVEATIIRNALALDKNAIKGFSASYLEENIADIKTEVISFLGDDTGGKIKIRVTGESSENISEEKLKDMILGQSKSDAQKILGNLNSIENISIKFWPFWMNKIPNNTEKVNIFLDRNNYFSILN